MHRLSLTRCAAAAILILALPAIADARGGGSSGSSSHSSSSSSRSYSSSSSRSYSSSAGYRGSGRTVTINAATGRAYTPREIRSQALSGQLRNVRTVSGAPLVIRRADGRTFVDGQVWRPGPVRTVSALIVNGRRTVYFQQPTRAVFNGRPVFLNAGPRYGNTAYWRTQRQATDDDFWWAYTTASMGFYDYRHPFGWYLPFTPAWYGHVLGSSSRADLYPAAPLLRNTVPPIEPYAGRRIMCAKSSFAQNDDSEYKGYRDLDGTPLRQPIAVWTVDGACPTPEHPPVDARYPLPVTFCEIGIDNDRAQREHLVIPIAAAVCPRVEPPAPTSDDDLTLDDGSP